MLEKTPEPLGRLLKPLRAGLDHVLWEDERLHGPEDVELTSDAFEDGGPLPRDCTADGPGASPPLTWKGMPAIAREAVLVVEDADSPTPHPLVHLLAWGLPGGQVRIPAGGFSRKDPARDFGHVGRNSFRGQGWLPPDPPTGHGAHRYVFQVFGLDLALDLHGAPNRHELVSAMRDHVVARGRLIGLYERSDR